MRVRDWRITDRSFLARGSDPTWIGKYELRKQNSNWSITIVEFQLSYTISNNHKEVGSGLNEREASDILRSYGAPTVAEITEAVFRYQEKQERNRHPGDDNIYGEA